MKVSNTNVKHIRFTDSDEYLIDTMYKLIDDVRTTMSIYKCDLMYNTQTGECVTLDEIIRMCGILGGLADMDEILKE